MCGRFYLDAPNEVLASHFSLDVVPDLFPRFNIAPSQQIAAVLMTEQGRQLKLLRWGLIPFWAKDEKIGYSTINARAETVDSKPAFRSAFKARRCLIPASGFYEWKTESGGKQPYCILPAKAPFITFAGLYEHWESKEGQHIDSCTIIVTEANKTIQQVHDRMPVMLTPENYAAWIDPTNQEAGSLKKLLKPSPDIEFDIFPVSKRVNSPMNDDQACIATLAHRQ